MNPADHEGTVNGVWLIILQHYFPGSQLYVHRAQEYVSQGFTDWWTHQWMSSPGLSNLVKRPFLVSQCKRESRQEDEASWHEAQDQLRRYLPGMALRSGRPQGPHYGVVIIGKKVKFLQMESHAFEA